MSRPLLQGEKTRLAAFNPETDADKMARWSRDSEFLRLLDAGAARPWLKRDYKEELEKEEEIPNDSFLFAIHTLDSQEMIGFVELDGISWSHGDAWVGIGIGERNLWGKGYGTDALREILRYAFQELNLHRVSLNVFEYNTRAVRSYEKLGFVHEGRARKFLNKDGRRWDLVFMSVLREEWERIHERGD